MGEAFVVARNPDPESSLPFLLRLPIDGGLWLKARESWPRASRVYCHHCEAPDASTLQVLERIPVLACERRGPAIDLILERGVNRRAQFVFTSVRGRPMIFWQTPKVAALARPGLRVPFLAPQALERIIIDTREKYGYGFKGTGVAVERGAVRAGDYLALVGGVGVATVERKSEADLPRSLVDGTLAFAMADLSRMPSAAVVVETSYARLLRTEHVSGSFLADVLARLHVRYPHVPIVFAESRALGERWTYAFFRAAAAERDPGALPLSELVLQPDDVPKPARRKPGRPRKAAGEARTVEHPETSE